MILSILIRTIPGREVKLQELMDVLKPQLRDEVEVLVDDTYPGTGGAKSDSLMQKARGEYVVMIDDDDLVPEYYVEKFLGTIKDSHPDVISIEGVCVRVDQGNEEKYRFVQGHRSKWMFETDTLLRTNVTQKGVVKKDIALMCLCGDVHYYDDRVFADKLDLIDVKEVHLIETMYIYRYTPTKEYKV